MRVMAFHPAPAMRASPARYARAGVTPRTAVGGGRRAGVATVIRSSVRSRASIIQTSAPRFLCSPVPRPSVSLRAAKEGDAVTFRFADTTGAPPSSAKTTLTSGSWEESTGTDTTNRAPRKVCIFVEPSPFSHVSGMKNRFLRLIENLVELGDTVTVVTPDRNAPAIYAGAAVIGVHGFQLPFYPGNTLLLSYAVDKRVTDLFANEQTRPDLLHCSSPGALIWRACSIAKKYDVPLVQSYHTHIPHYIPQYTWAGLVKPMWDCIRIWTRASDLTMVTSTILQTELKGEKCPRLAVWQKGVDTVTFNPEFRSETMHLRLCGGRPGTKVIGCVGRLGAEKNLKALKTVLETCPPGTNLALIGDGPERKELEKHFAGTNTTFTGMLHGDDLAAAYASLDVFVMPSESETLGFVVMEAMASGVPVVAVKAGGLQDILTNTPEVGRLYPSQDYARAGALTSELLTDEDEWQRQRKSCRDAVEEWSWMASNRKLRDSQYAVAIARFTRIRRQAIILSLLRSRRRTAAVVRAVLKHQWLLTLCVYTVCVVGLASARHVLLQDGFTYASGAGFENAASSLRTVTAFCGPFAPAVAVTVIAFVSIMPFVPVSPLLALCGLMFGVKQGALIGLLGMTEASAVAFTFARQMGFQKMAAVVADPPLKKWFGPKFGSPAKRLIRDTVSNAAAVFAPDPTNQRPQLTKLFAKLAMYRLAPNVPFTVGNYVLGVTKLSFPLFMASTICGIAPWCFFFSAVGASVGAVAGGAGPSAAVAAAETVRFITLGYDLRIAAFLGAVLSIKPIQVYYAMKRFGEDAEAKSLAA